MSTTIRPELTKKSEYYIPKDRYYELKHFCLQYPAWRAELNAFTLAYPQYSPDRIHDDNLTYAKPTEREVERRERFINLISLVNMCIINACSDHDEPHIELYLCDPTRLVETRPILSHLYRAVTRGLSYDTLKTKYDIPCSREYYYKLYRRFFWLLDAARK